MRFVGVITLILTDAFFNNSEINPTGTAGRCFFDCFGLPITVFYPASFSTLCFCLFFAHKRVEFGLFLCFVYFPCKQKNIDLVSSVKYFHIIFVHDTLDKRAYIKPRLVSRHWNLTSSSFVGTLAQVSLSLLFFIAHLYHHTQPVSIAYNS